MSAFLRGLQAGIIHYMIGSPFGFNNPFSPFSSCYGGSFFSFNPFFNSFCSPLYNHSYLIPPVSLFNTPPVNNNYTQYNTWEATNFTFVNPTEYLNKIPTPTITQTYSSPVTPQATFGDSFTRSATNISISNHKVTSTLTNKKTSQSSSAVNTKRTIAHSDIQVKTQNKSNQRTDVKFDKMLNFVLECEGGLNSSDGGQKSYKGILQSSYDDYRKRKGLEIKDVELISDTELKNIYYEDYYLKIGADKVEDPTLALYLFDTAVNMGVGGAKKILEKSGYDAQKVKETRIERYKEISNNTKRKTGKENPNLNGWLDRVEKCEKAALELKLA